MSLSPAKINLFLLSKLPSAWFCGVRLKHMNEEEAVVTVKHSWINQNPFNSMYFAVQAMAAELSTGALVMDKIKSSDRKISMLVANNKATFTKKATGKISFTCSNGKEISAAIVKSIETGEGQTCWMQSVGVNEEGITVSHWDFEWTVKVKGTR